MLGTRRIRRVGRTLLITITFMIAVPSSDASLPGAAPDTTLTAEDRKCLSVVSKAVRRYTRKKLRTLHRCREAEASPGDPQCADAAAEASIDADEAQMRETIHDRCTTEGFNPAQALGYSGCPNLPGCTIAADASAAAYAECIACATRAGSDRMFRVVDDAACGNGKPDTGEECDNGATNSDTTPDACRTDCQLPHCGDGVTDSGEECDSGATNSDTTPDACRTDCRLPRCGDGIIDSGETCEPALTPTRCAVTDQCVPAGLAKACTCIPPCTVTPLPAAWSLTTETASGICGCTVDSTAQTTCDEPASKIRDLDCGDLFIGGGLSTLSPGRIPDGANLVTEIPLCGGTELILGPSAGSGPKNCSKGLDVGGSPQCFFGPPLPLPHVAGPLSTCILNGIGTDVTGTVDVVTAAHSVTINLSSSVFLTGINFDDEATPELETCPRCVDGGGSPVTNGAGTCNAGRSAGLSCESTNSNGLTIDCLPADSMFIGHLLINLDPLTTGTATMAASDGNFCNFGSCSGGVAAGKPCDNDEDCPQSTCQPRCQGGSADRTPCTTHDDCQQGAVAGVCGQATAGAFRGGTLVRRIIETGIAPPAPLAVGDRKAAKLGTVFCVPKTGDLSIDAVSNLPGPGATSLDLTISLD
jgi:hypothetical protein